MELSEITVDEEIKSTIPKLSDEEFRQLKENILEAGSLDCPLIVYTDPDTGQTILLDGHNRRTVLLEHPEIEYDVLEKEFPDRYAAIVWVCHNQTGRRNITAEERAWLIGTAYDAQMKTHGGWQGNQYVKPETKSGEAENSSASPKKNPTREEIKEQFGASDWEVRQDVATTRAVKEADTIQPGFSDRFRSGGIKSKDRDIQRISKASDEEKPEIIDAIYNNDVDKQAELGFGPKAEKPAKPSRYTDEEIEKAGESLEGFDSDPFANLGELDGNGEDSDDEHTDISDIHIRKAGEEAEPISPEAFADALRFTINNMDKSIEMHFNVNSKAAESEKAKKLAIKELEHGREVIDKYIDMLRKEED